MGLGKWVRKKVRKLTGKSKRDATAQPNPAPEIELINPEGDAEKKEETVKKKMKKGKRALKIDREMTRGSVGRNIP